MDRFCFARLTLILVSLVGALSANAVGPGFTYQGLLEEEGVPVDGSVILRFSLWDAEVDGDQIGDYQIVPDIPVANGQFSVLINGGGEFGPNAFNGEDRWLQVEDCPDGGCEAPSPLLPRQMLTAAPFATRAETAPWSGLTDIPAGFADGVDNSGDPVWGVNGADAFYNVGNVGIGSATPHHRLRISGGPPWTSNGWGGAVELENASAIGWQGNPAGRRFGIGQSQGGLYMFHTSSDPGTDLTSAIYDLTIGDSGNVGIGTITPSHPLTIQNFAGYGLVHTNGQVEVGTFVNGAGGWFGTRSNHSLHFFTKDSAPQVTLNTSGEMGIGAAPVSTIQLFVRNTNPLGASIQGRAAYVGLSGIGQTGVFGTTESAGGIGVHGHDGGVGLAGQFTGNVNVTGSVTKSGEITRIDHPLDPASKFLTHSSVESPDRMNVYNGNITTDTEGDAEVVLPDYFEALNKDFRYQLTVIGQFAQAIVSKEIENHSFEIKTDKPNVKVSWQVTGVRQDAYAKAHPMEVEKAKPEKERGKYLSPEVFGQPKEMGIFRRPEIERASGTVSKGE